MNWFDEFNYPEVGRDPFGGRILYVEFDITEKDDGPEADLDQVLEDEDKDEVLAAHQASHAWLIVHANGHEVWTRGGLEFALDILYQRTMKRSEGQSTLFD